MRRDRVGTRFRTVPANRSPRERPDSRRNARRREAKNASRQHGESRLGEIPHGPFEIARRHSPPSFRRDLPAKTFTCAPHTERSRRVVDTTESSATHLGMAGVAGVEATPSTKAEFDQRGTGVRRADGSFLGGLTLPLRLRRLGRRLGASETKR
jgi:hypothetical protein